MANVAALVLLLCFAYGGATSDLFEGDILLDPKTNAIVNGQAAFDAVASEARKWPDAKIPYTYDSNVDSYRRQVIKEAIKAYNKYTCIRFIPRSSQKNYVKFIVGEGCYSYIGMLGNGEQPISIGQGCEYKGIVMHEMMHASGFWHEQSRLDRDQYVKINWHNVQGGKQNFNFRKYSHGEADYYGESYDFDSVMHYGNWDFSVGNGMTIEAIKEPHRILGQRDSFSQTDIKQLNKVYKCKGYENVKAPPLKGCIDRHEYCFDWAEYGDCETNKPSMLTECCKSCKDLREGGVNCVDRHASCKTWADAGHCSINPGAMKVYCKKSCRLC